VRETARARPSWRRHDQAFRICGQPTDRHQRRWRRRPRRWRAWNPFMRPTRAPHSSSPGRTEANSGTPQRTTTTATVIVISYQRTRFRPLAVRWSRSAMSTATAWTTG